MINLNRFLNTQRNRQKRIKQQTNMTNAFSINLSFTFIQEKETNTIVFIHFIFIQSILILSSFKCALSMNESFNKKSRQKRKNEQFDRMI